MRLILTKLGKMDEVLCAAARQLAGLLLIAMVGIVIAQVFFRYVLNDSLIWTEELAKAMMVWTAFLVAPWAYRVGANVSIDIFADELPRRLRQALTTVLHLLVLWIIIVFLQESVGFWQRGLTVRADSLPIQVAWFYLVVPVSFALLLLVGIEQVLRNVMALLYPAEDWSIASSGEALF